MCMYIYDITYFPYEELCCCYKYICSQYQIYISKTYHEKYVHKQIVMFGFIPEFHELKLFYIFFCYFVMNFKAPLKIKCIKFLN